MWLSDLGKFNIPFGEALAAAASGVVSSILWTSKEWWGLRGKTPYKNI
ncbi:hypothetical protein ANASTE_00110 [Anaerofustis stercorihominis DSM 17244]|uniref:Uncharacterized protein n=1 Tax=Anaerofustis stercorihominis DSM 17244 TaxID=445971 RepID=B1C5X2_9FIRM|nr:hypothetical protein ANASTE_00110 [Anaerofustis stercorihominis DSM 17244]